MVSDRALARGFLEIYFLGICVWRNTACGAAFCENRRVVSWQHLRPYIYDAGSYIVMGGVSGRESAAGVRLYWKYVRNLDLFLYWTGFLFQFENFAVLLAAGSIFSTNIPLMVQRCFRRKVWFECIQVVLLLICVTVSVSYIYMGSYDPFLYFMF